MGIIVALDEDRWPELLGIPGMIGRDAMRMPAIASLLSPELPVGNLRSSTYWLISALWSVARPLL